MLLLHKLSLRCDRFDEVGVLKTSLAVFNTSPAFSMAFPPQKTRTVDSHVRRVHPPPPPLDPVAVGARWMRCWGPSRAAAFAITRHHRSNLRTNPTCTPKLSGAQEAMAAGFLLAVRPLVLTSNTISLLPRWQKLFSIMPDASPAQVRPPC